MRFLNLDLWMVDVECIQKRRPCQSVISNPEIFARYHAATPVRPMQEYCLPPPRSFVSLPSFTDMCRSVQTSRETCPIYPIKETTQNISISTLLRDLSDRPAVYSPPSSVSVVLGPRQLDEQPRLFDPLLIRSGPTIEPARIYNNSQAVPSLQSPSPSSSPSEQSDGTPGFVYKCRHTGCPFAFKRHQDLRRHTQ